MKTGADRLLALMAAISMILFASCGGKPKPQPAPQPQPGQESQKPAPEAPKFTQEEAAQRQSDASLLADLGQVYLNHRRFDGAVQCFAEAIEKTRGLSENAVYHWGLAEGYEGLGRMDESVANYQQAIGIFEKILPNVKDEMKDFYHEKLCILNRKIGNREAAISWAEKIAGEGKDAVAVVKLARLYSQIGESALAIDTYKMAIKKLADAPEAMNVKVEFAEYLAKSKQLQEARTIAEEVAAKSDNKMVVAAAKRLLLQIYDGLGILDKVDIGTPKDEEEKDKPKDGEEK